jgi:hypothetical protein
MPPRRPKPKDTPAKLASRMKRRFRIVLMRKTGQVLGTVEATDAHAAEKVAAIQFELDEFQRRRLLVHWAENELSGKAKQAAAASSESSELVTYVPPPRPDLASAAGAGVSQPPARCAAVCCPVY